MSDIKNNNNLLKKRKASKKQIEEFDLQKYLVDFLWSEPFYSRILRSLNKEETNLIPTAGVTCVDGDITLYWNREFLASLTKSEITGLLKHECLHLVFGHTTERRRDPHIIWNYGTDLAINSTIPMHELPQGGLIPGKELILEKSQLENMSKEEIDKFNKLSNLIASFPLNKTSEFYFEKLMSDSEIKEFLEEMSEGKEMLIGFDDHDGWDDIPEEEKELLQGKIKEIIKEAIGEAESRNWGSISSETRKEIYKIFSNKIKWESLLKRFCGFTRRDDRRSSIRKLNRKYPGIHPGTKKIYKPMIAVYIDESGSVSNEELSLFYSELDNLSKNTDFYLYKFDHRVDDKNGFLWKKNKRPLLKRNLTGGTCFNAVANHADKNKKRFDGYIVLTDGGAPKPKSSIRLRRCWVLAKKCVLAFENDKADIVINM
jgi:predicted metal-dependent peptidase